MPTTTEERRDHTDRGLWLRFGSRVVTLAIVMAIIVGGILAWRAVTGLFHDLGTEVRPDDDYSLTVEGGLTPGEHMTVVNNTDIALRLHVFNADDGAKVIARENIVIEAGGRASIDRVPSVFNVWKSQIFDVHLTWTRTLYADTIVITGDENGIVIDAGSADTTFVNEVDEHLKVCTYQTWDALQAVPLQCWTLAPDQPEPVIWTDPPGAFVVKVFRPQLIDDLLTVRENVPAGSTITLRKG